MRTYARGPAGVRMDRGRALLFEKDSLTNLKLIVAARLETGSTLGSAYLTDGYHYTLIMWVLGVHSQVVILCVVGVIPTEPAPSSSLPLSSFRSIKNEGHFV